MVGAWRFELQTSCRWLVFECAILLASILSNFRITSYAIHEADVMVLVNVIRIPCFGRRMTIGRASIV
jgi:hypothetical protein